jgi:hypothetical protein
MLAQLNPQIVAELNTLAAVWTAVATDLNASAPTKPARGRERKRKAKTKS